MKNNAFNLKAKITKYLLDKGFKPNYDGFHYLRYGLQWIIENDGEMQPMTKIIYPEIAKKFKTTWKKVERCIRYAKENSKYCYYTNTELLAHIVLEICG